MKKVIFVIYIMILLANKDVFAVTIYDFLPGGVNYIDEENLSFTNTGFLLDMPVKVKPNTSYTFSFPGFDLLGNDTTVSISGDIVYLNGDIKNNPNCTVEYEKSYCTFTTTNYVEKLYLDFEAARFDEFLAYFGFTNFQLEEGNQYTEYEIYIAPNVDLTPPSFQSSGTYTTGYLGNETVADIISSHISAVDNCDGDITEEIIVIEDNYTGFESVIGEYTVKLKVTDSSGNYSTFDLLIVVVDSIPPVISGPNNIEISCDENVSVSEILSNYYSAFDDYETELSISIVEDNFTGFEGVLGDYFITIEAIDSSFNSTQKIITVSIIDDTAPILISALNYDYFMSSSKTSIEIIDELDFSDNYYEKSQIEVEITSDSFTSNQEVIGEYIISLVLKDPSGNENIYNITINCFDDVPPELSNSNSFMISSENEIDLNNILNAFIVEDNCDDLFISDIYIIENHYSNDKYSVGLKKITFGIEDMSNNQTTFTIDINVIDNIPPIIYIDSYIIEVDNKITLSNDDILRILKQNQEVSPETVISNIDFNEYQEMETIPGTYLLKMKLSDGDSETIKEILIKVNEIYEREINVKSIVIYSLTLSFIGFVIVKKITNK